MLKSVEIYLPVAARRLRGRPPEMALRANWITLIACIYIAAVLVWLSTAVPLFERSSGSEMSLSFAGSLHSHGVCETDTWLSTISFVKAHGFKVVPSMQKGDCVPAMVAIINVCVLWFLVASAVGWGITSLMRCCVRMGQGTETQDEERADVGDCRYCGLVPRAAKADTVALQSNVDGDLFTRHEYVELERAHMHMSGRELD